MFITGNSGFPKATNASKMIDKEAGAEREVIGRKVCGDGKPSRMEAEKNELRHDGYSRPWRNDPEAVLRAHSITAPATEAAKRWDEHFYGLQAIKPSHEPILLFQKPHEGRPVDSILKWGCGALNVGACRIGIAGDDYKGIGGGGTHPRTVAQRIPYDGGFRERSQIDHTTGRWPATILLGHAADAPCPVCNPHELESVEGPEDCPACGGGGWIEGCRRVGTKRVKAEGGQPQTNVNNGMFGIAHGTAVVGKDGETVDNWKCVDGCAVLALDEQAGVTTNTRHMSYKRGGGDFIDGIPSQPEKAWFKTETGGPSRFFYTAKASRAERAFYCRDCQSVFWAKDREPHQHGHVDEAGKATWDHLVQHPTVKPLALIGWICRLVTPKGGTVLDPFLGTGTTAVACRQEGFGCLGMEQDPEYAEIARMRAGSPPNDAKPAPAKRPSRTPSRPRPANGQKTLF